MKLARIFLVFLILSLTTLSGQSDLLKGILIDAQTIEPVAFATVRVKGRAVGVVSNPDGSFQIPKKFKVHGDTLEISSMGYENREILISTLSVDKVRRVYIQPGLFELDEAVVRGKRKRRLTARQIVRKAIENIPKNYSFEPFSTVGYYRDYQLKENRYINLNEAILEVFDSGFGSVDSTSTEVQIYDYKKNMAFERDTLADEPYNYKTYRKIIDQAYVSSYGGNEFSLLRVHNAVRNYELNSFDFVNNMELDLLRNHQFSREPNSYVNGEVLFVVSFRNFDRDARAQGNLYISAKDFAIHKMEYVVNSRPRLTYVNGPKKRERQLIFEVNTEYQRRENKKMFLNYISFHNNFRVSKPSPFYVEEVLINFPKRRFEVSFSLKPDEKNAQLWRNYNFKIKGKKMDFERLVLFENKVFLYPKFNSIEETRDFEIISELSWGDKKDKKQLSELLKIKIDNISDQQGNFLNRRYYEDFNQYREFFVQKVKPIANQPMGVSFMDSRKPIFDDQPISPPENFDDYWMNTPLQKIEIKKPAENLEIVQEPDRQ